MRIWSIYLLSLSSLLATEPRITDLGISTFSFGKWQAADVDGDGDQDFVSTPRDRVAGAAQITWFENLGEGTFSHNKHLGYIRETVAQREYLTTDSNRDGILDFLTFLWTPEAGLELHLLDPLGTGNQTHVKKLSIANFSGPLVVDLAGGNQPFIVDFSEDTNVTFQIFEITPERTLTPLSSKIYSLPEDFTSSRPDVVKAADFDQDGDLDLLISESSPDRTYIFERISPTEFSEQATHEISEFYENVADLDGDGDLDLYSDSEWGENTGDFSSLVTHRTVPSFYGLMRTPSGLRFMDRDGLDFVEYQLQADKTWIETYRQPVFPLPSFGLSFETGYTDIRIADLNGDGFDEIALIRDNTRSSSDAERSTYHLTAFTRTQNGYEEIGSSPPPIPIDYRNSVAADFDNDGDVDVLMGPTPAGEHFIKLNDGKGNFTLAPSSFNFYPDGLDPSEFRISSLRPVHFDDDEHLDLAVTFEGEASNRRVPSACTIIKGAGPLTFKPTVLPEGSFSFVQVGFCEITEFVDWDGDGDLDAILEGGWRENINGELSPLLRSLISNGFTTDALGNPIVLSGHQIADIDNDGAPDYIASAYTVGNRYCFLAPFSGTKICVTLAEALELDIPIANLQSELFTQIAIAFNKGDGTIDEIVPVDFTAWTSDALGNPVKLGLNISDLNSDGKLELVAPIWTTDALGNPIVLQSELWSPPMGEPRNFAAATRQPIQLPSVLGSELRDFDGDGTLEYASANYFVKPSPQGPQLSPIHSFTGDVSLHHTASPSAPIALADFDGDGDLDHLIPDRTSRLSLVRNLIVNERSPITMELLRKGFIGAEANPGADCDGDGFSNAHEYLFGTDPTVNQIEEPANLAPFWVELENGRELKFLRRRDAARLKLDYVLERSLDLENWEELPLPNVESTVIDETWEWVTTKGLIENGSYFFRTHPQHRP